MGTFEIDKKNNLFRKIGTGKSFNFEEVSHLRLAPNPTGFFVPGLIFRLPFWLFIHFNNGPRYRIAMGKKQSIQLMLDWFQDAGISINNGQSMKEDEAKREKQAPFD